MGRRNNEHSLIIYRRLINLFFYCWRTKALRNTGEQDMRVYSQQHRKNNLLCSAILHSKQQTPWMNFTSLNWNVSIWATSAFTGHVSSWCRHLKTRWEEFYPVSSMRAGGEESRHSSGDKILSCKSNTLSIKRNKLFHCLLPRCSEILRQYLYSTYQLHKCNNFTWTLASTFHNPCFYVKF